MKTRTRRVYSDPPAAPADMFLTNFANSAKFPSSMSVSHRRKNVNECILAARDVPASPTMFAPQFFSVCRNASPSQRNNAFSALISTPCLSAAFTTCLSKPSGPHLWNGVCSLSAISAHVNVTLAPLRLHSAMILSYPLPPNPMPLPLEPNSALSFDSDDELELLPRVDLYKRTSGWS